MAKPAICLDDATLRIQLRQLDIENTLGATKTDNFQDILTKISATKDLKRQSTMKAKKWSPPEYRYPIIIDEEPSEHPSTKTQQIIMETKHKSNHTISRFHDLNKTVKFDTGFGLTMKLKKQIYRDWLPKDTSGRRIFNLERDLAKNVKPWKPGPVDRDFSDPGFECCTDSFRDVLLHHMHNVVKKVEDEYRGLKGESTERVRNYKANVGAALYRLSETEKRVTEAIHQTKSTLK